MEFPGEGIIRGIGPEDTYGHIIFQLEHQGSHEVLLPVCAYRDVHRNSVIKAFFFTSAHPQMFGVK